MEVIYLRLLIEYLEKYDFLKIADKFHFCRRKIIWVRKTEHSTTEILQNHF